MPNEAIEQEARSMGWVPQTEFRGDESKFVDAEQFVERGKTVLPILRKHNAELEQKLAQQAAETKRLSELFAASQESIQALKEFQEEDTARKIKQVKAGLLAELKQAKKDQDVDLEVQLTDELTKLNTVVETAKPAAKPAEKPVQQQEPIDPSYVEFASQNTWFGQDVRKTNLAMGIANVIRSDPENDKLVGREFFAEVLRRMNQPEDRPASRVEGGRPSGGQGAGSGKKGFSDLPPDAKQACTERVKKMVGEGRAFKTEAEWKQRYAEIYFQGEE